jgi:hypothetical protein
MILIIILIVELIEIEESEREQQEPDVAVIKGKPRVYAMDSSSKIGVDWTPPTGSIMPPGSTLSSTSDAISSSSSTIVLVFMHCGSAPVFVCCSAKIQISYLCLS